MSKFKLQMSRKRNIPFAYIFFRFLVSVGTTYEKHCTVLHFQALTIIIQSIIIM